MQGMTHLCLCLCLCLYLCTYIERIWNASDWQIVHACPLQLINWYPFGSVFGVIWIVGFVKLLSGCPPPNNEVMGNDVDPNIAINIQIYFYVCFALVCADLMVFKCVCHSLWMLAFDTPLLGRGFHTPLIVPFLCNICVISQANLLGSSVLVDTVSNVLTLILFVTSLGVQCSCWHSA